MAKTTAILYPLVSRHPDKSLDDFNEWYDTIHAPSRARCPGVHNVRRFSATDDTKPEWLAIYELEDIVAVHSPEYVEARMNDGDDESKMFSTLDRRVYNLISDRKRDNYDEYCESGKARDMVHVALQPGKDMTEEELHDWYDEEHTEMLMKCPGWLRSTRWQLVDSRDPRQIAFDADHPEGSQKNIAKFLAFHEWEDGHVVYASEEFKQATNTPWRTKVMNAVDENLTERRKFKLWKQF